MHALIFYATLCAATAASAAARTGTWSIVDSPSFESNSIVLQVAFDEDGTVGYAGGSTSNCPAHIQKSSDGGKTWNVVWPTGECTSIDFNLFLSAAARDAKHAVVGGSFFQMYTDDGASFKGASNNFGTPPQDAGIIPGSQKKFALVSGKEARAGGNSIDVSLEGAEYTKIPIPDTAVNSSNGFLARYGAFPSEKTWYVTLGSFGGELQGKQQRLRHLNKHLYVEKNVSGDAIVQFSEHHPPTTTGGDNVAAIAKTTDGGSTWSLVYKNDQTTGTDNVYPNGIHCASTEHCVAVLEGDSARILVTRDGGKSWNETMKDMDPHSSLFAVRMLSEDEVWVAGGHPSGKFEGRFWHSLDGGNTWKKTAFPGTYIVSLDMQSASGVGYAVALTSQNPAGLKLFKYQTKEKKEKAQ